MHVIAIHTISDPETFWGKVQSTPIPDDMTLHSVLPNEDGSRAVCVWEADSGSDVEQLVEETVGEASSNEFFEVNAENAQGLPG